LCPAMSGGNNFWSASYSPRTRLLYIPSNSSCNEVTLDTSLSNKAGDWKGASFRHIERNESDLIVADPFTGEVKKRMRVPYPNYSAALTTGGGLMFTGFGDGSFAAYDDESLEPLWKINVGSGFNAPPMTFEAGGRQYVAILSGLSQISKGRLILTPELREMRNQTMLFVFGL
jgi:alcohol dehydrogenase (cytochrome c)